MMEQILSRNSFFSSGDPFTKKTSPSKLHPPPSLDEDIGKGREKEVGDEVINPVAERAGDDENDELNVRVASCPFCTLSSF